MCTQYVRDNNNALLFILFIYYTTLYIQLKCVLYFTSQFAKSAEIISLASEIILSVLKVSYARM
jgi:hypothetical protein